MKARFLPTGASNFSLLLFFSLLFLKKRGRDATLCAQDVRATLSLITASSGAARNHHRRWPQQPILQTIATAGLSNDPAFGNFLAWFVADGLVQVGIKLFSNRIDWFQSISR